MQKDESVKSEILKKGILNKEMTKSCGSIIIHDENLLTFTTVCPSPCLVWLTICSQVCFTKNQKPNVGSHYSITFVPHVVMSVCSEAFAQRGQTGQFIAENKPNNLADM